MTASRLTPVVRELWGDALRSDGAGLTDGQLLERFLADRDQAAFEALLWRHGSMVLGVCRRLLRHEQDAQDAFQATFLVLARKADSVVPRERVGNWLHGVARTTALRARAREARRRARERQVTEMPEPEAPAREPWDDLLPLLDEELARLPGHYRAAFLCDLEGRPRKEAARQLGIPEGTLSSRLTTARRMLAARLRRRGLTLPEVPLGALLAQQAERLSAPLVSATMNLAAAGQGASAAVTELTEGVLKAMLLNRLKVGAALLLVLAILGSGVGVLTYPAADRAEAAEVAAGKGPAPAKRASLTVHAVLERTDPKRRTLTAHLLPAGGPRNREEFAVVIEALMADVTRRSAATLVNVPLARGARVTEGGKTVPFTNLARGTVVVLELAGRDGGLEVIAVRRDPRAGKVSVGKEEAEPGLSVIFLRRAEAVEVARILRGLFAPKRKNLRIEVDVRQNALLLRADPMDLIQIRRLIAEQLDARKE